MSFLISGSGAPHPYALWRRRSKKHGTSLQIQELGLNIFCIILCWTCTKASSDASGGSATGILRFLAKEYSDGTGELRYQLQSDDGVTHGLEFCSYVSLDGIPPNCRVIINYEDASDVMRSCQRPTVLQPPSKSSSLSFFSNTMTVPAKPRFLVFTVTLCGWNTSASTTPQGMYAVFLGNTSQPGGRSMGGYFNTCSYGQVTVQPSQVTILPITIPCSGEIDKSLKEDNKFDSKSCDNDNPWKWQVYARSVAAQRDKINPIEYHHQVMFMPKSFFAEACGGVAGFASVGPWIDSTSLAWISGEGATDHEIILHELGHNMGLAHADVIRGCSLRDQCDHLCPMGAAGGQGIRCFNAPHNWQLGWGSPIQHIDEKALGGYGRYLNITLPLQLSTRKNFITVALDDMAPDMNFYLSARINVPPYDLPFVQGLDGKPFLVLHAYSGTENEAYKTTVLMGEAMQLNESIIPENSSLVARFVKYVPGSAGSVIATLCRRKSVKEQVCGDGLDDDCDQLEDAMDPDCMGRNSTAGSISSAKAAAPPFSPPSGSHILPPSPPYSRRSPPRPAPPPGTLPHPSHVPPLASSSSPVRQKPHTSLLMTCCALVLRALNSRFST